VGYLRFRRRITKSLFAGPTIPLWPKLRFRLVGFLRNKCLLKDFWKVISPFPVTLKRFFALELVLTFGIINNLFMDYSLLAASTGMHLEDLVGKFANIWVLILCIYGSVNFSINVLLFFFVEKAFGFTTFYMGIRRDKVVKGVKVV
jgi:hypothetical protein